MNWLSECCDYTSVGGVRATWICYDVEGRTEFSTMMDAVMFYLWVYVAFKTFQVQTTYLPGKPLVVCVVPGVIDR